MAKFTQVNNGYMLEIEVDEASLLAEIDKDIQEMEELKKKHEEYEKERIEAEENGDKDYDDWRWEYDMSRVYGDPESDWCTPDEIIKDREAFKAEISRLANGNGSELWAMASFKKNGTFKKNAKPMIREAVNGSYWEDSYGWNTLVLRLVPIDDTHAYVELDTIVLHY